MCLGIFLKILVFDHYYNKYTILPDNVTFKLPNGYVVKGHTNKFADDLLGTYQQIGISKNTTHYDSITVMLSSFSLEKFPTTIQELLENEKQACIELMKTPEWGSSCEPYLEIYFGEGTLPQGINYYTTWNPGTLGGTINYYMYLDDSVLEVSFHGFSSVYYNNLNSDEKKFIQEFLENITFPPQKNL